MKKIIIQKGVFLDKIAYIEDNSLKKIKIINKNQKYFEKDIFIAKKKKQNMSMNAFTLSLDEKTDGFMHYKDDDNSQYILCQVKKVYNNDKNIKLTNEITLVGKYIIYIKGSKGLFLSNKSKNANLLTEFEKNIDKEILKDTKIILRSTLNVENIKNALLEVDEFEKIFERLHKKAKLISKPQLIYRQYESEEIFLSKLNKDVDELVINDKELSIKLKKSRFKINDIIYENENIFEKKGINSQIKELLSDKISMKNGINLYIQKTEAMHIIDVNSAGYFKYKDNSKNAYYINSLVIPEIARQIELRDISGIILIDFIEMNNDEFSNKLIEIMQEHLNKDERKASVVSVTKSSLMQIIRKKEDLSLSEILEEPNAIKLYSTGYIFEQISEKLSNMQIDKDTDAENLDINLKENSYSNENCNLTDIYKNDLQNIKKIVSIYVPTFETNEAKSYIKILEEKYNIKINPTYMKRNNLNIKIEI